MHLHPNWLFQTYKSLAFTSVLSRGERQKLWSIMFTTTGAKREGLGSKARLKCEAFGGSTAPSGDAKIWAAVGRVALSSSSGLLDSPQTSRLGSLEDDA